MKKYLIITLATLAVIVTGIIFSACERRPLEDEYFETALIPVRIDWRRSGIAVTQPDGNGLVHRVSVRFFPLDGSPAFDRYLETNVIEGEIAVPIGQYRIVIFNESVDDTYWDDVIQFSDINDFDRFAANIVPDDVANYPLYTPLTNEQFIVEPFRLASWSLDYFEVTKELVASTRKPASRGTPPSSGSSLSDRYALLDVEMRPLTYNVNVSAHVKNLCSTQLIQTAMRGFSSKVYMASAVTEQTPSTHIFKLNGRTWDDPANPVDGTTRKSFLSFGRLPQAANYWINLDVLFVTGELYAPATPFLYDVTPQVDASGISVGIDVNIDIDIKLNIDLPYVEGGIHVGEWDDENITLQ